MGDLNPIVLVQEIWLLRPKSVEHGHIPDDVVKGVQWVSVIPPDARRGHLHR